MDSPWVVLALSGGAATLAACRMSSRMAGVSEDDYTADRVHADAVRGSTPELLCHSARTAMRTATLARCTLRTACQVECGTRHNPRLGSLLLLT